MNSNEGERSVMAIDHTFDEDLYSENVDLSPGVLCHVLGKLPVAQIKNEPNKKNEIIQRMSPQAHTGGRGSSRDVKSPITPNA